MSARVSVHHEWGALEEVVVGLQPRDYTVVPDALPDLACLNELWIRLVEEHGGERLVDVDARLATALEEQADRYAELLEGRGVKVHRPKLLEGAETEYLAIGTLLLFPRDPIAVIGNSIIELAMNTRMRRKERWSLRPMVEALLREDPAARWVSMPEAPASEEGLSARSPMLEGGDIHLNGHEIYVGISGNASNPAGVEWLQQYLGEDYRVYPIRVAPELIHLDCVMSLVRPGLGVRCREMMQGDLPGDLRSFAWIDATPEEAHALGCNGCVLDEETILIDADNGRIADELRRHGQEVIALPYAGPKQLGGSLRCSHHPLRRRSRLT